MLVMSAHYSREPFNTWHKKGFDRHLLQTGRERDPRAAEAGDEFGRPVMVTPGTPLERVRILRESFAKVLQDPELLAEAKKSKMEVEYSSGEELESLIKEVLDQPPEVIAQARKILGN